MEKEEQSAQSAKLQELIRRGGPEDLQEANRLMKVMAGYDTKHKTDYRAKAAEEVSKVQQKARLLEERLQNIKEGEVAAEGDVFEVRSGICFSKLNAERCRSLRVPCKVHNRRSRRCVKRNRTMPRPSTSFSRSMTVYIGLLSDTSS